MAFNKRQQQAVGELYDQIAVARALTWPSFRPDPEKPITHELAKGYTYNAYNRTVTEVWQELGMSYDEYPDTNPKSRSYTRGSRGNVHWWDTPEQAARAMICELAQKYGRELAEVYRKAGISLVDVSDALKSIQEGQRVR